ncbi:MAG: lipid-A-disaccharide synthase, partial [Bacteroidales bacterium]|nr:lipid-A-disaccharide synthase [Bacteroidales bacterium]
MKYYIIAGEASGDLHGSNLMQAIIARDPQAEIRYWGGDRMAAVEGNTTMVKHIRELAIMGFVEVALNAKTVVNNLYFCKLDIMQFNPDAMVFIDYPGFNLKIAKYTREQGFRNYYYISPQVWAWKQGRLKAMRRDIYKLCYILPSERKFYSEVDFPQAIYVGHPLLDEVGRYRQRAAAQEVSSSEDSRPIVALLPGSRRQELRKTLPTMLRLARRHPEYQFVVAGMSLIGSDFYSQLIGNEVSNLSVVYDSTYDLLSRSFAAVVCSGTATLETALFRVPQVVCYRGNPITIGIAAFFIKAMGKLKYISLVNLIADEPIVRELIQNDVNDANIEAEFRNITVNADARNAMLEGYGRMI